MSSLPERGRFVFQNLELHKTETQILYVYLPKQNMLSTLQMKLLVGKKQAGNPMYLSVACEELRVFGVFEQMGNKLKSLPHTLPQLLGEVLARLEEDHGESLVAAALCLLACSRNGEYCVFSSLF